MNWIKNGPDVQKPEQITDSLLRLEGNHYRVGFWGSFGVWRCWPNRDAPLFDEKVTHFAIITEPEDE